MIWMTKLLHLSAISVWAGGLLVMPFLLRQRSGLVDEPLHRLHRLVRTLYVSLLSPAAFVAIASGTALIFLQSTFFEWFSVKLLVVGILSALHVRAGLLVLAVFDRDGSISRGGALATTGATVAAVTAILVVVLWKPLIDVDDLAPGLFQPGGLAKILAPVTVWVTP
jgi:uncharacterized membrane protein